ncbi:MAG TPA: hypothetical protein DEB39_04240 [Planctomycetaceae bacterium]|nr:hypothetical protein [Planctomycetaceae bacterium]
MSLDSLYEKLAALPPSQLAEVENYVRFIRFREHHVEPESASKKPVRRRGCMKGYFTMMDGFDEPDVDVWGGGTCKTMDLLLDAHALIWHVENDPKLPNHLKDLVGDRTSVVFVSIASLWERAIKEQPGKLRLQTPISEGAAMLAENEFRILPIELNHIVGMSTLELHHKDPFDRMLIAQALTENFALVGCDDVFDRYGVRRLWEETGGGPL